MNDVQEAIYCDLVEVITRGRWPWGRYLDKLERRRLAAFLFNWSHGTLYA